MGSLAVLKQLLDHGHVQFSKLMMVMLNILPLLPIIISIRRKYYETNNEQLIC